MTQSSEYRLTDEQRGRMLFFNVFSGVFLSGERSFSEAFIMH